MCHSRASSSPPAQRPEQASGKTLLWVWCMCTCDQLRSHRSEMKAGLSEGPEMAKSWGARALSITASHTPERASGAQVSLLDSSAELHAEPLVPCLFLGGSGGVVGANDSSTMPAWPRDPRV